MSVTSDLPNWDLFNRLTYLTLFTQHWPHFFILFLVTVIICRSSIFNSIPILIRLIGIKHLCQMITLQADIPYLVTISKVSFIYLLGLYHGLIVVQHLYKIHRALCAYVLMSLSKNKQQNIEVRNLQE